MPCYYPINGFRGVDGGLSFSRHGSTGLEMRVPCGRCIGCRLERSRQWAVRCMDEAQMHEENSFVTLTYADEFLPSRYKVYDKRVNELVWTGSVLLSDFQKFMKRLRRVVDERVRFFHCGEYGEDFGRPHYHALLFGFGFPDRTFWLDRGTGPVFRSELLEELWPKGQSEIGSVTFESAAYVARYVTKKVTGSAAADHYRRVDESTGEFVDLVPEYATMSRRPGIGHTWLEEFYSDVYPGDHVYSRGRKAKPPRYYDEFFRRRDPEGYKRLKEERRRARKREDETPDRLAVREVCAKAGLRESFGRRLEGC